MRTWGFLIKRLSKRFYWMVNALLPHDTLFLLAIHPPKASHLCKQPCQRPQLCSPPEGQIRLTHGCRYRAHWGNGRRFTHLHLHENRLATDCWFSLVSYSQHHGDAGKLGEQEPTIQVSSGKQSLPTHQCAVPSGRVAPHLSIRHRHRIDARWTLVRKHKVRS